ncbi:SDR family NAD(P)-dependent oxidoreductase [Streptomyces sp. NPDC000987]|uniref:SDR family NAD(P)-dependent oxidoreductase n=1 Tax=Streptomyces sp. NPDC000987 TaxID=3154374 RepID=UPI003323F412
MDSAYWADNLRQPVLFADAVNALFDEGITHVVEISPHPVLTPALEQLAALRADPPAVVATLRRDGGTTHDLHQAFARGYVRGLEPFGTLPRRALAPVPGYPWQRDSYWPATGRRRAASPRDLDITLQPTVAERDAWQGSLEVALEDHPWFRDHQVHGAVVLPAAAMMELALRTARARTGGLPGSLTAFTITDNLTLGEEPVRVGALWRDDVQDGGSFTLLSLPPGATSWVQHATARVLTAPSAFVPGSFPQHMTSAEPVGPEVFYRLCGDHGLMYGPAFQGVESLRRTDDAVLAHVSLPARCRAGARPGGLHPALWDAALQACLTLNDTGQTVVPVTAEAIHVHADLAEPVLELWSYVVRRDATRFDIALFDVGRRPLLTVEGLTLRALPDAEGDRAGDERVHHLRFREVPRHDCAVETGRWLVWDGDRQGSAGRRLAGSLSESGADAAPIPLGGGPFTDESLLTGRLAEGGAPNGIVFLAPPAGAGLAAQRAGLSDLAALVRSVQGLAVPPRLAVVTFEAQAAVGRDRPDPGGALYWGFTRVLGREHPELEPLLLDVAPDADGDWSAAAAAELLAGDGEDQVVLRGRRRLVGRLVRGDEAEAGLAGEHVRAPWATPAQPFRLAVDRPGRDGLDFRPLSRRAPAEGEVEIEVSAAGLGLTDAMTVMDTCPGPDGPGPLGREYAGTVTAVGAGVTELRAGDRVVACADGCLASHVTVRADHVRPIPEGLDDATAAALPTTLTTAWYGLVHLARLRHGETVLIHSAAGGLGLAAVRVARAIGAHVLATAGREEERGYLRDLGIDHVFDSRDLSWAEEVRAATGGRGVDVVLNSLTGVAVRLGLDALAEDGRFVETGTKDIDAGRPLDMRVLKKGISVTAVDTGRLMRRRPGRFARALREVWALVQDGRLEPSPVTRYDFAAAGAALRALAEGAHIGAAVLVNPASVSSTAPQAMPEGRFRADGTYLVTGGLGALGMSLAAFLTEHGAGAVVLMGRSEPRAETTARIAALRAGGARVETMAVDVSDPQALGCALDRVRAALPPLRGVFHAAGLLDDSIVLNLRAQQLERVLAPKVDGARNLDAATSEDPLDLFVMFSSAAALVGNAGQAAYAAANSYMDALAHNRRRRGVPGLSVQWGVFESIGLVAGDARRGAQMERAGMGGFSAREAWTALMDLLDRDEQSVGYFRLDLRQWFDTFPDTAALRSWRTLLEMSRVRAGDPATGSEFLAGLMAAPPSLWPERVEAKVRELAGGVLRLDTRSVSPETPFKALGLDSLMGLELRNRLESVFGLRLSPTLLWSYGTTRALAGALCERLAEARTA